MTPPPLACIGVTRTYGAFYDRAFGALIRWATATKDAYSGGWVDAPVNHAVLYVGPQAGFGKPQLIEARPHGAGFADWDAYGESMIWLPQLISGDPHRIAATALSFLGVGYGWLDLVAIAFAQQRFRQLVKDRPLDAQPWWVRRVESMHTLICSQLCDAAYQLSGVQLFDDARIPGLVSPADLYSRALTGRRP